MNKSLNQIVEKSLPKLIDNTLANVKQNRYRLNINKSKSVISVLQIEGSENLNYPWNYTITFTSSNKQIEVDEVLNQSASLTFEASSIIDQFTQLSQFSKPTPSRTLYGVITEFSLLSISKDEARYQVTLSPRLALLANSSKCAIYQHQSVVNVVESVLRDHGFTGIDYRLELNESYPVREFITQWQESDLAFIQRLLADIGVNFWFESHGKHHCDVLVISDEKVENADQIPYKEPSDMMDGAQMSVWDLRFKSKVQPQSVITNDYNYRTAEVNQSSQINRAPKDNTTVGTDYHYGEHYKNCGDETLLESGAWYAKIRHEAYLSEQFIIKGKTNNYNLMPGQRLQITGSGISSIGDGILILTTNSTGDRSSAYQCEFTAVPYHLLKPYRPQPKTWPQASGTLPARITSPDNDTYGYLDNAGRYRVKFDFDLKTWKKGEESLWVRLAKPYAGSSYGFHFPLIDGTEVAIAFTGGNPDRPYIAHAMHDSNHNDHVSIANKHRNVIRTPTNNKLRMDDKRGQEHIKLATEYGKTQLNLGHLVNSERRERGEGFELRTDEWGAIRGAKGVQITTEPQNKASGKQLDMQETITHLEKALTLAYALTGSAKTAGAEPVAVDEQKSLLSNVAGLKNPTLSFYGDEGIAHTTPQSLQLSAGKNVITTSENDTTVTAFNKITMAAGKMLSFFAQKLGIKLIAAAGKVQIQAQSDEMELAAKENIFMNSTNGKVTINAKDELLLLCGGGGIRIKDGKIELIAPHSILQKTANLVYQGAESLNTTMPSFQKGDFVRKFQLHYGNATDHPLKNQSFRIHFNDGRVIDGVTDENGETDLIQATELEKLHIEIL